MKQLAGIGNGGYFYSPTGEDLENSFLNVLNIVKKNVASDFILNDSFLGGVKILDEEFPSEVCSRQEVSGNFSVSCKRNFLFSLGSEPFNFSFFVNVTSSVNKLSTGTFVSYKNYSGKESVLFLSDKSFEVIDNSVPTIELLNCSLLSGGFCSSSLENASINSSYFCDVSGEFCYSCNEGFYLNSSTKQCVEQKQICEDLGGYCSPISIENGFVQTNGNCDIGLCYLCNESFSFDDSNNCVDSINVEWVCENGLGFSYWKKGEEKEWIYSSSDSDLTGETGCNKYGDSFCCPDNFVCESGFCVFQNPPFFEYCSSLTDETSCDSAPRRYAKDEIFSLRGDNFLDTTCASIWYEPPSNPYCSLKSSCSCFWNSSLGKCLSSELIEDSCEENGGGTCIYDRIREENNCDTTGYYFREFIASISGDYPSPENCVNVSQEIKCPLGALSLPFFGVYAFLIAFGVLFIFYLFFTKNKN